MKRYLADVVPSKRPTTQSADLRRSKIIVKHLGKYSLTALTPEVIAHFRDTRLAGEERKDVEGFLHLRRGRATGVDRSQLSGPIVNGAAAHWRLGRFTVLRSGEEKDLCLHRRRRNVYLQAAIGWRL